MLQLYKKKSFILCIPLEGDRVPSVVRVPQIENDWIRELGNVMHMERLAIKLLIKKESSKRYGNLCWTNGRITPKVSALVLEVMALL